jgi:hypothetical protein
MTNNDQFQPRDPFENSVAANLRAYAAQAAGNPTDAAVAKAVAAGRARRVRRFALPRIRVFAFAALVVGASVGTALLAGGLQQRHDPVVTVPAGSPSAVALPSPTASAVVAGRAGLVAYSVERPRDPGASTCPEHLAVLCTRTDAWVANADGSNPHRLFPDEQGSGAVLGWSVNGSTLLYQGGPTGLAVADASGTIVQAIDPSVLCAFAGKDDPFDRNRCTGSDSYALSPDGTQIAFVRGYGNAKDATVVAILDLRSGTVTVLATTRATNGSEQCWTSTSCEGMNETPRWSPDGRQLLFARQVISPEAPGMWTSAAIYAIGADGTGLRRITPAGMVAFAPSWSPDGTSIAFVNTQMIINASRTSVTDMLDDVWTVRLDGTDLSRLTDDGGSYAPSWTVDGQRLTFARDGATWVMDLDGSGQTRLDVDLSALSAAGCQACLYPAPDQPVALWQPAP